MFSKSIRSLLVVTTILVVIITSMGIARPTLAAGNGRIAFTYFCDGTQIMTANPDGTDIRPLIHFANSGFPPHLAWSPNGEWLLFDATSSNAVPSWDGNVAIFLVKADGSNLHRLTNNDSDYVGSWSPDGKQIVFGAGVTPDDPNDGVYIINIDGTNQHKISSGIHAGIDPSWSPDGNSIVLTGVGEDHIEHLYEMNADGLNVRILSIGLDVKWPKWSPDGKRILFTAGSRHNPPGTDVFVMNADGSNVRNLTNDGRAGGPGLNEITWSPDGTQIAFVDNDNPDGNYQAASDTYIMNIDGGSRKRRLFPITMDYHGELGPGCSLDSHSPAWQPIGSADNLSGNVSQNSNPAETVLCNGAPASRVSVGSQAQRAANTRFGNGRVRKGPEQKRVANFGEVFTIVGGPKCGGASTWWQVQFSDGFTGWMMEGYMEADGPDYYIEPVAAQTIPQAPSCPIHTISADSSLSEGVVEGKVLGTDPCDATIEIHNTRSYWVNLNIIPLGGSKATPAGGDANLYAKFGILGPDASVHYTVSFPKPGRSIQVQVDTTFGTPAKIMNFTQFLIDGISLEAPESGISKGFSIVTEYYPKLQDLYSRTPNLRDAMNAVTIHRFPK